MKNLILAVSLVLTSSQALASGCFPDDVYLVSEDKVSSFGVFTAEDFICNLDIGKCEFSVYRGYQDTNEFYVAQCPSKNAAKPMPDYVEIFTIVQHWESSCREMTREVRGADIDGVRFRTENDLTTLH